MNTAELLKAYETIRERNRNRSKSARMPEMHAGGVRIDSTPVKEAAEVRAELERFQPSEGWIGFQSANRPFRGGELPLGEDSDGVILSAECIARDGRSLHVRQNGDGGWSVTTFSPADGEEGLWDIAEQVAHGKGIGLLRYRRYWRIDAEQGAAPFAACFIGFETLEEDESDGA